MINKITLNNVASYKHHTVLETNKKINLVYGLNGTGKSTLSNFLYNTSDLKYKNCSVEGLEEAEILVYNQLFIKDNFFEPENQKGIFTLSKTNKNAELKIADAEKEIKKIEIKKLAIEKELQSEKDSLSTKIQTVKNNIWEIKTKYTGGDRVLEFCLEGYKSDGIKLLSYVESLIKPETKPLISVEQLKDHVQEFSGDNAQKYSILPSISFFVHHIEEDNIFQKQIVGNENSTVAEFINKIGNSDWVKMGVKYLPLELHEDYEMCPFCQKKTISKEIITSIKDYFNESYENDINKINEFLAEYRDALNTIPEKSIFEANPKLESFKLEFEIKFTELTKILSDNIKLIEEKIKSPSLSIKLIRSKTTIEELTSIILSVNELIEEHNNKINKIEKTFKDFKTLFWEIMRWEYDQTISLLISDKSSSQKRLAVINKSVEELNFLKDKQYEIISNQQKLTVNIDKAISNINLGLVDLGIDDFRIAKNSGNLYQIVRNDNDSRVFHSLSEGEKMIISFLYFVEACRGKKSATETAKKKIIVIDDPISSLSHIYVFNVGRMIINEFVNSDTYEQFFLLTHSLYFFYELTDTNHERREENQKLFRIFKNSEGTQIMNMKYEEIQNDYHSYWYVIKDEKQPPALIANCMRNVIEYFFNFVEKKDFNNVFQKPELKERRFEAFKRYLHRESHSLGQNIFDYKEFDYNNFKDALALVFKVNGYEDHYKKMINNRQN